MLGVKQGLLLPHLGVQRMLLKMFGLPVSQSCRISLSRPWLGTVINVNESVNRF